MGISDGEGGNLMGAGIYFLLGSTIFQLVRLVEV